MGALSQIRATRSHAHQGATRSKARVGDMSNWQSLLAERIESQWENVWSGAGLSDQGLIDAVIEYVKGEK